MISKIQVEPDHYFCPNYDSKGRFASYWHQAREIIELAPPPNSVLEIGVGNRFVSEYLRSRGVGITTLDIDERLKPDVVGSVLQLPFGDSSFDTVACYEVLEHLPFNSFPVACAEIYRVCKKNAVLSIPDSTPRYRFLIQLPKVGEFRLLIPRPRFGAPVHRFDGEHHWELGKKDYPLKRILDVLRNTGFHLRKNYRVFEHPYHRFIVLEKRGAVQITGE